MTELKIKRGFLFLFGFVFFLFPSNNWYSIVQANYQTPQTQPIDSTPPSVADYPVNFTNIPAPWLTARSAVVIDRDSAVIIVAKNEEERLLPASTIKLMTALVVKEHYDLNQVLRVEEINRLGQDMELVEGEMITVKNLLYGVLISSANDAALVLAKNYPGGTNSFVNAMNEKAQELNLSKTYFANPTGIDVDENDSLLTNSSFSTSLDLARLASIVLQDPILREMVNTREIMVTDISGEFNHFLYNINELLHWLPGMKGVKTGWTEEAKECLVGYVERDNRGIITVVLGSEDRFGETARLIDWAFTNHQWEEVTPSVL